VTVTIPAPVTVPALVWPGVREYVTAPLEAELAVTWNGETPYVCAVIVAKLSVGVSVLTVT
jgi:hypothetical protein